MHEVPEYVVRASTTAGCGIGYGVGYGVLCCMLPNALIIKFALYGMNDPKVFQNVVFTLPAPEVSPAWDAYKPASWLSPGTWFGSRKGFPMHPSTRGVGIKDILSTPVNGTLTAEPYVCSPTPSASGEWLSASESLAPPLQRRWRRGSWSIIFNIGK